MEEKKNATMSISSKYVRIVDGKKWVDREGNEHPWFKCTLPDDVEIGGRDYGGWSFVFRFPKVNTEKLDADGNPKEIIISIPKDIAVKLSKRKVNADGKAEYPYAEIPFWRVVEGFEQAKARYAARKAAEARGGMDDVMAMLAADQAERDARFGTGGGLHGLAAIFPEDYAPAPTEAAQAPSMPSELVVTDEMAQTLPPASLQARMMAQAAWRAQHPEAASQNAQQQAPSQTQAPHH